MNKLLKWISKNKGKTIGITVLVIIVPMLVTHVLFKINLGCYYVVAEWDAGDMLGYFGDVLSFLGTFVLGYVAITQTERANSLSNEMVKLEWEKRKPFLDVVQNQKYKLYFSNDNLTEHLDEFDFAEDMLINPCYIREKRTGIVTTIAVMEVTVQNIGNADIRNVFIKTNYCYLCCEIPQGLKECIVHSVMGNTYIKAGAKKKLIIQFTQELDENNDDIEKQVKWATESTYMIPAFDFDLHLVTSDGNEYKENLVCGTSISVLDTKNKKIERNLSTLSISVERIQEESTISN